MVWLVVEFKSYFEHVKTIYFEDRPDYDYLKRLFRELFLRRGYVFDNLFDWDPNATPAADGGIVDLGPPNSGEGDRTRDDMAGTETPKANNESNDDFASNSGRAVSTDDGDQGL